VIVTGDEDLLVLGTYEGVTISTPQDWLERIDATRGPRGR